MHSPTTIVSAKFHGQFEQYEVVTELFFDGLSCHYGSSSVSQIAAALESAERQCYHVSIIFGD